LPDLSFLQKKKLKNASANAWKSDFITLPHLLLTLKSTT
jgi:hypothetical protein